MTCGLSEKKKGDRGDTARHIRRLADALRLNGEEEEAEQRRLEAETIRKEVQGERFHTLPDDERTYNLMVYKAFW